SNGTSHGAMALAIISLEVFAGVWINAFLVCVLCIAWVKKKTLNSNEKILLLLGCSRFCYLCFSWVHCSLSLAYPNYLYVQPTFQVIIFFRSFFTCSNLWVSACLFVFYCIKIANFRNRFFIYLKVKTDRIVPWLLLASLLSALAISIIAYDLAVTKLSNSHNSTGQGNSSKLSGKMDENFFQTYLIYGFGFATSFTAVICSTLLLLFFLWRHTCKMQKNSMNSLSMDAHIKAMKSILSFFIMYSINFTFLILSRNKSKNAENYVMFLSLIFMCAFPGVHSLILIFSNPKMEKMLIKILCRVKCKLCIR
uniref:taste receptor type 2 member 9-like n=1 Tax=Lonchura striata TaxID=40157 RepID=UPI000B4C514C